MNDTINTVGGIVLAAGSSRRFGQDKRTMPMPSGRTMLEDSIHLAIGALTEILVILRFGDANLAEKLEKKFGKEVENGKIRFYCAPDSAKGMAHSLANAIHLVKDWEAAVIMLGDMPYVESGTIKSLVRAYQRQRFDNPIVIPVKNDRQGHPVIFHHEYFSEIESLKGDTGARPVIDAHKDKVFEVVVKDAGIFLDVDLPEDLAS